MPLLRRTNPGDSKLKTRWRDQPVEGIRSDLESEPGVNPLVRLKTDPGGQIPWTLWPTAMLCTAMNEKYYSNY